MLSILLSIVIGVLLTTPMAWISRRFIEEPFIAISRKWRDQRREVFTPT
jgi:peptidoglycan/LPS O-acetylase OafA/YrhL